MNKEAPNGSPKWFRTWHSKEFFHLSVDVRTNRRVQMIIVAIVAAILIKVLLG